MITIYCVTYRITTPGHPDRIHETRCIVEEGYSTVDDIPRMISLVRGCAAEDVDLLVVVTEEEAKRLETKYQNRP